MKPKILAAIAVPNFLEAQTRAKVTRVKADMRSVITALEAYAVDTNKYPFDFAEDVGYAYYIHKGLTTPVSYMPNAARITDIFSIQKQSSANNQVRWRFRYRALKEKWMSGTPGIPWNLPGPTSQGGKKGLQIFGSYFIASKGPDGTLNLPAGFADGANTNDWLWQLYDPTNGTISAGDVMRGQTGDINVSGYDVAVNY